MNATEKKIFLFLIIFQALHSTEEYFYSLWEVFAPARAISSLVSSNLPLGFAILNSAIVLFGIWSYLVPVRRSTDNIPAIVWFWILLESANGLVHIIIAGRSQAYFPGLYTSPFLIFFSLLLLVNIAKGARTA